jgi:hypothetical protein
MFTYFLKVWKNLIPENINEEPKKKILIFQQLNFKKLFLAIARPEKS